MTKTARRVACRTTAIVIFALTGACAMAQSTSRTADRTYQTVYRIQLTPGQDTARASIRIGRGASNIRELRFSIDPKRHREFQGDGNVSTRAGKLVWEPPADGGLLSYEVTISQSRGKRSFDARVTDDWALFRAGDVFPPAATRTRAGAKSKASLILDLPDGWSAVTPYRSGPEKMSYPFDTPSRRFDRPTGWVLAGKIGVRRAKIAGTRVAIASPVDEDFRRMDVMAFLNWTLPGVRNIFPTLDKRLVIVGAGDPMWRGGLSGPGSLYLHADRPLISENGTSTLLHELVHVAMGVAGAGHDDWIVEGLAEYYSIKILHSSGSLSERRMELALQSLRKWGEDVDDLFVRTASGAVTARAATILAGLDAKLVHQSTGGRGLDDVVAAMIEDDRPFSYRALCIAARGIMGGPVPMLAPEKIPGAPADFECRVDAEQARVLSRRK